MKHFAFLLILLSQVAVAQTLSEDRPELEAQRREFESHLYSKIDTAIGTIVEKGSYILDVSVALKRMPPEVVEIGSAAPEKFPLTTNKTFDGSEGLVPLTKIGLWQSGLVNKRKMVTRQVRRFFDLIQTVTVDLYLDPEKVSAVQKNSIQRVAQSILKSSSPIPATVNLSELKISYPKKVDENLKTELINQIKKEMEADKATAAKEAKEIKKDMAQWASEFKIPLSIVFTTFAIFVLGLIMNRRQALHDERRLKLDEEISKRQEEQLRSSVASESGLSVGGAVSVTSGAVSEGLTKIGVGGFDQFAEIVTEEPSRASYLLKQWIYSSDVRAQGVLAILPRVVPMSHLSAVLQLLSDEDRKEWSRLIHKPLATTHISEFEVFVAMSLASSMVEPVQEIDEQVRQLLATLTPQEGADCIWEDKSVGVLLVQALPSLQVSRIFSLLDVQTIRDVALASTTAEKTQLSMVALKFQQCLSKVRRAAKAQTSAFVERVPDLIREVGFAKELALFDSVAQTRNLKLLQQIALEYFPAELISDLPTDILKSIFDRMTLADRAELVYSQSPEMRRVFFHVVGEGRLKDILEIEIEQIDANESRKRSIARSTERIWQSFVDSVRQKINGSPDIAQEIEPLISGWAKQRVEAAASGGMRVVA